MNTMITDAAVRVAVSEFELHMRAGTNEETSMRCALEAALPLLAAPEAGNPVSAEGTWQHEVDCIANNLGEALEGCDDRASAVAAITPYIDELFALAARQPVGESIGTVGSMPGTDGFTMACFKADEVPVGTRLYAAPPQQAAQIDLGQFREAIAGAEDFISRHSWVWNGVGAHPNGVHRNLKELLALIDSQGNGNG